MNTSSTTPPSGSPESDFIHASVPIQRELGQIISQISHQDDRSKASIWRQALKMWMAATHPDVLMEVTKKGLLTLALAGSVFSAVTMGEIQRQRGRFTRREIRNVRTWREEMAA